MVKRFLTVIGAIFFLSAAADSKTVRLRTQEEPDTVKREEVKVQPRVAEEPLRRVVKKTPGRKKAPEKKRPKKVYPRIQPGMLFAAPTAHVISSLAIQSVGGGTVSPQYEEQKRKFFLGVIGIGLGDVAELQINTCGVFNNLSQGTTNVPATSFKLRLLKETSKAPAAAIMLRASPVWITQTSRYAGTDLDKSYDFMTKSATLYLVASKSVTEDLALHVGATGSDYRLKTANDDEESKSTMWGGLVGFEKKINGMTNVMGEYQRVPKLEFSIEGEGKVEPVDLVVLGVRFFFIRIMSLDAGMTYASDYEGIADMVLHTNLTCVFSLVELYERLFKK